MFRWSMSLETGNASVDHERRILLEAMADYFQIIDDPTLNQKLVAEKTGAIYTAMKNAFTAESPVLQSWGEEGVKHEATHASFLHSYVELCKKLVPKIKNLKQAQQACLEIYRLVEIAIYHHITEEAVTYKHWAKHTHGNTEVTAAKAES
jgi:hemerythrin